MRLCVPAVLLATLPACLAQAVTQIFQSDFNDGTYIIDTPGEYILREDISFKPTRNGNLLQSAPELWMFPNYGLTQYDTQGFRLGHFAAIVISADDVVLDLDGHLIEQSEEHALMQRFFAIIELTTAPFPNSGGPADFGTGLDPANNVVIRNGFLGRSSHHGIHGNANQGVTLTDLDISNFEVAGIALNRVTDLRLNRVDVHDSCRMVPANTMVSHATSLLQTLTQHLTLDAVNLPLETENLEDAIEVLRADLYDYLDDPTQDPTGLFASETGGLPDGSMHAGIMIHGALNTGDFATERPSTLSDDIYMNNVRISDLDAIPLEIGALYDTAADTHVHGAVAAVFPIDKVNVGGVYVGNAFSDLQVAVANYSIQCQAAITCTTKDDPYQLEILQRTTITDKVIRWTTGEDTWADLMQTHTIVGNHDTMHHFNKGVVGLKVEGVSVALFKDVDIYNIRNSANSTHRSQYAHEYDPHYMYSGFNVRGMAVSASTTVKSKNFDFAAIHSEMLGAQSVDLIGDCDTIRWTLIDFYPDTIPS